MKPEDRFYAIGTCIVCFLCTLVGVFMGVKTGGESVMDDAVKAGVAEYYIDSNHNKQFRWKTQQTQ